MKYVIRLLNINIQTQKFITNNIENVFFFETFVVQNRNIKGFIVFTKKITYFQFLLDEKTKNFQMILISFKSNIIFLNSIIVILNFICFSKEKPKRHRRMLKFL